VNPGVIRAFLKAFPSLRSLHLSRYKKKCSYTQFDAIVPVVEMIGTNHIHETSTEAAGPLDVPTPTASAVVAVTTNNRGSNNNNNGRTSFKSATIGGAGVASRATVAAVTVVADEDDDGDIDDESDHRNHGVIDLDDDDDDAEDGGDEGQGQEDDDHAHGHGGEQKGERKRSSNRRRRSIEIPSPSPPPSCPAIPAGGAAATSFEPLIHIHHHLTNLSTTFADDAFMTTWRLPALQTFHLHRCKSRDHQNLLSLLQWTPRLTRLVCTAPLEIMKRGPLPLLLHLTTLNGYAPFVMEILTMLAQTGSTHVPVECTMWSFNSTILQQWITTPVPPLLSSNGEGPTISLSTHTGGASILGRGIVKLTLDPAGYRKKIEPSELKDPATPDLFVALFDGLMRRLTHLRRVRFPHSLPYVTSLMNYVDKNPEFNTRLSIATFSKAVHK
jgi:hypothetical protein